MNIIYNQTEKSTSTNDTKITCSQIKRQVFDLLSATTWERSVGGKNNVLSFRLNYDIEDSICNWRESDFDKIGPE